MLVAVSGIPNQLESKTSDAQFRFSTTNIELEGTYQFSVELFNPDYSEVYQVDFTLEVIDNPCSENIDVSNDG